MPIDTAIAIIIFQLITLKTSNNNNYNFDPFMAFFAFSFSFAWILYVCCQQKFGIINKCKFNRNYKQLLYNAFSLLLAAVVGFWLGNFVCI